EGLEDPAHVRILQGKAELDPDVTEAHVPELPKAKQGFLAHGAFWRRVNLSPGASALVLNQQVDLLKARLGEVPDHDVGAAFTQLELIALPGDPDDEGEAPFRTRLDTGDRILDDDRLRVRHTEVGGRRGKNVGLRLSFKSTPGRFHSIHDHRKETSHAGPSEDLLRVVA